MTRTFISFPIADLRRAKTQLLIWADRFPVCSFLDNHQYEEAHHTLECILAADALHTFSAAAGTAFDQLYFFHEHSGDWIFGHFGYDLKNETEATHSSHSDGIGFPDMFFYVPRYIIRLTASQMTIGSSNGDHAEIHRQILRIHETLPSVAETHITISNRYPKEDYIDTVEKIRKHIVRGDCYEVNLCQEFFAENVRIHPLSLYRRLSDFSPNPFSAYYKADNKYLLCMSPERYLKKEGRMIISQPVKGTAKRNATDRMADEAAKNDLQANEKERAENIMVVDLVRNDLSRVCEQGTVHVDELCAVYSFPQVHQMISTVSGTLKEGLKWTDAVKYTFPMGSMTGAPKKRVMELIEKYERSKRGLFSGSIGYITPDGDFDLNVVIRSVLYNAGTQYLSFHTGSAITFNSEAEKEYEECLLKAEAIKKALAEASTLH